MVFGGSNGGITFGPDLLFFIYLGILHATVTYLMATTRFSADFGVVGRVSTVGFVVKRASVADPIHCGLGVFG